VAIAFAAQAQPKPRQAYVAVNQLGQTAAPDDSTLNARVGKDVWQIKMAVPCHNLSFNASGYLLNLHRRHNQHLRAAGPGHFRARDKLKEAFENNDLIEIADACADLKWVIEGLEHSLGIPQQSVWDEVSRSNMSKMVDGKLIKRADGKVLKPDTFVQPNIKKALGI